MQGPFRSISQSNRKRSFSELSVTFEVSSTRLHFRMISRRVFISTSQSNSFVVWHLSLSFGSSHSSTKSQVYFSSFWFFDQEWPFKRFSSKMNGHGPWIMSMKLEGPNNWKVDDLTWRIFGLKWSANESKRPRNLKWLTPTWPPKMGLTVCFRS